MRERVVVLLGNQIVNLTPILFADTELVCEPRRGRVKQRRRCPRLSRPLISPLLEKRIAPKLASVHRTPKLAVKAVREGSVLYTDEVCQLQRTCLGGEIYNASPTCRRAIIEIRSEERRVGKEC